MALGKNIETIMLEKGLSIAKLSEKSGVEYGALYSLIKRDSKSSNSDNIKKIAAALDVPISDLIEGDAAATMQASQAILNDFTSNPQNWHKTEPGELTELVNAQREERLKKAYYSMNEAGQEKAVERVEELTEIPKYQKE